MSKSLPKRALSEVFFNLFLDGGALFPLLKFVQNDYTLCMELRGNNVVIYYRGGLLYKIDDKENGNFKIYYNKNYKESKQNTKANLVEIKTVSDAVNEIPWHKQDMDIYFSKKNKLEREFQQLIERENNYSGDVSHVTDYFILDIEYAFNENDKEKDKEDNLSARFDMLGVKWLSTAKERKNPNDLPIAFIEVKYGDGAITGDAGISKHIDDYIKFRSDIDKMKQLAEDMQEMFNQKHRLGLISSYKDKDINITINHEDVEFIFVFANHDPDKTAIKNEFNIAIEKWKGTDYLKEIKVAKASEMGYGLFAYKGNVSLYPTIEEYVKLIQIT